MSKPHLRRKRRRPASEPASQYPGFFALPRPSSRSASLREALLALLVLVVFIAGMALFFHQTAQIGEPREESTFVMDTKATNQPNRFSWE